MKRFQVVQKAFDLFEVSVVHDAEGYPPEVLTRMTEAIHARLGREIRIEIRSATESELVHQSRKAHPIIPLHTVDFGKVREA